MALVAGRVVRNPRRSERYPLGGTPLTTRGVRADLGRNERYPLGGTPLTTRGVRADLGRNERYPLGGTPLITRGVRADLGRNERSALESPGVDDHVGRNERFDPRSQQEGLIFLADLRVCPIFGPAWAAHTGSWARGPRSLNR
jgi:hypothetical protein